jgi:hypothetical protein
MYSLDNLYFLNEKKILPKLEVSLINDNDKLTNLMDYIVVNKIHFAIENNINNIYIYTPLIYYFLLFFSLICYNI